MIMSDVISAGNPEYNLLTFSWDLIDVCQYKCSYCSAMNFNVKRFLTNPELKTAWRDVIKKLKLKSIRMPFAVEILGGEPTLHPDIDQIINSLCEVDNCIQIDLITNLAKPVKFYKQFNNPKNSKLAIEASFHPEYDVDGYKNKVVELNNCEHITIYPNINLPTDKHAWPVTLDLIAYLQDNDVKVGLNFLQDVQQGEIGSWTSSYPEEFWDVFEEHLTPLGYKRSQSDGTKQQAMLFLKSHAGSTTIDIPYQFINGTSKRLSEAEINRFDLRRFEGWNCRAMMYHIDMSGNIKHHCTGEDIPAYKLNKTNLTCSVICPLERCDCDTKFLYVKSK